MSVARFIADQRTFYRVPYAVCCAIVGVSTSWCTSGSTGRPPPASGGVPSWTPGCSRLFDGVQVHLRLAADPRRPARGGLGGQCEHRRGLDAQTGSAGPQTQAQ